VSTLQGIPGISPATQNFVQMVRLYLRDYSELNRLISGEETSDRMIAWAVLDAVSDFNSTPHPTNVSLEDMMEMNLQSLLLRMTVTSVIESVGLLQTRNHINYSTGGMNVGVNDKTPLLLNWLQYFKGYTEQMKTRVKVSMNINSILGSGHHGVHSEYWAINSSYLSF
jgi:hypothetical protein